MRRILSSLISLIKFHSQPPIYRIVLCCIAEDTWYEVQKKLWYGYVTLTDGGCDDIGEYSYPRKFNSIEEAERYINIYQPVKTYNVVKEIQINQYKS